MRCAPHVPRARICYSCFRAGHVSASCRSTPRCLYCGEHLPTSPTCPILLNQKRMLTMAAEHNIPLIEAKKRVASSSSTGISTGLSSNSASFPCSPFASHNRFDVLNNHSSDFPPDSGVSYAQIVAGAPRRQQAQNNSPSHSSSSGDRNFAKRPPPRPERIGQEFMTSSNGRTPSFSGNGTAFSQAFTPDYADFHGTPSLDAGNANTGFGVVAEILNALGFNGVSDVSSILQQIVSLIRLISPAFNKIKQILELLNSSSLSPSHQQVFRSASPQGYPSSERTTHYPYP
ncbi:PREDICTED: uncharacterized protein LOC105449826 [Wasmannia auropunctata]|uniref:uncharacterized protein LOC105449826 n=1 Tax=Wasmannia auropunctata TaxID=64793 RepID=UPI0005EE78BC|nr:PREDICTED: uncharacterized protein LOC105449826 [Wasmannia auropunctata]